MSLPVDDPLTGDPASPDVRRLIAMLHPGEVLRPEWTDFAAPDIDRADPTLLD